MPSWCRTPTSIIWMVCEALYTAEKVGGTELAAILELMTDWMSEEIGRPMHPE
jgi:hypothetical protein